MLKLFYYAAMRTVLEVHGAGPARLEGNFRTSFNAVLTKQSRLFSSPALSDHHGPNQVPAHAHKGQQKNFFFGPHRSKSRFALSLFKLHQNVLGLYGAHQSQNALPDIQFARIALAQPQRLRGVQALLDVDRVAARHEQGLAVRRRRCRDLDDVARHVGWLVHRHLVLDPFGAHAAEKLRVGGPRTWNGGVV